MTMDSSHRPIPLDGSEVFYSRIILDMMATSQQNQNRMPRTACTIMKPDITDNAHGSCGRDGSAQRYDGGSNRRLCGNLDIDTENPQSEVDCMDRANQPSQAKHLVGAHHLFENCELRASPSSTTASINSHHALNEALNCLSSFGTHGCASECHDNVSVHPDEFIIGQKSGMGHGIDPSQVEVSLPSSLSSYPGRPVKQEATIGTDKPAMPESTGVRATNITPPGTISESFGGLPGSIPRSAKSIPSFGYDWPALSSMEALNSAPTIDNTILQSTAALENIEGCWWGDGNHLFATHTWPEDMNDSLTNMIMTQRDPSIDSIENRERFPSPYDSQCSPVSSFASNGFTPETITLAPQELETPGREDRHSRPELFRPSCSQRPTIPSLNHMAGGYMQVDKSSNMTLQTEERVRGNPTRASDRLVPQRSSAKDAFLVRSKRAGMSYKEIKEKGRFSEAESTLRGRYRTLTKRKELRVRKPEWKTKDVRLIISGVQWTALANSIPPLQLQLLREAVRRYTRSTETLSDANLKYQKVPWKLVGQYIWNNGGSYHFGNATCKKKWAELEKDLMRLKDSE